MTENVDWELKDRRIAFMNINSAVAQITSARINAGLFKPKDQKEAVKDLLMGIEIEMSQFLNISSKTSIPSHQEQKTEAKGVSSPSVPPSSSSPKNRACEECGLGITEKVADYSSKKFSRQLCFDCQKKEV